MDEKLNINLDGTNEGDQEKVNAEVEKVTKQVEENIEEEKKELTEEEKKEIFIKELKNSKLTYHPRKHFGVAYHKKRNAKNKAAKKSRKINRKK